MYASVVEDWPQQWPPDDQWPGLAPAVPDSGQDAAEVIRGVLEEVLRVAGLVFSPRPYLALVPAERPADIPAVMAWDAEAPHGLLSAMLRSWEDRFGARVVAFEGATLHVSVARPPVTAAGASLVAFEHVLLGDDNPGVIFTTPTTLTLSSATSTGNSGGIRAGTCRSAT
jgi:hypothetical protein